MRAKSNLYSVLDSDFESVITQQSSVINRELLEAGFTDRALPNIDNILTLPGLKTMFAVARDMARLQT